MMTSSGNHLQRGLAVTTNQENLLKVITADNLRFRDYRAYGNALQEPLGNLPEKPPDSGFQPRIMRPRG